MIVYFEDINDHGKFKVELPGQGEPIPAPPADWEAGHALLRDEVPYRWIERESVNVLMMDGHDHDIWLQDFHAPRPTPAEFICVECRKPILQGEIAIQCTPIDWRHDDEDCRRECSVCGASVGTYWSLDGNDEVVCPRCDHKPYDWSFTVAVRSDEELGSITHVAIFTDKHPGQFATFTDIPNISISNILAMSNFIGNSITQAVLRKFRERNYPHA